MAKHLVQKDTTSRSEYIFIQDSSVTTGAGKTGLVYNTASLVAYYVRPLGSATAITLATQTVTGAYSSGGFVEVDATNMPGVYRLDIPNAVFATGADKAIVMLKGASNMAPVTLEYQLTGFDPAAPTWMASYTQPAGFLAATFPAGTVANTTNITAGTITTATNLTNLPAIPNNWLTAAGIAADAITDAKVAADVTIASVTGAVGSVAGQTLANLDVASSTLATAANLATVAGYIDTEVASILAAVDTEVAAIKAKTDNLPGATMAELAQGIPPATPSLEQALMALYMTLRNRLDVTATTKSVTNDAGTVIFKKALSDDGTTYSEAEAVSGP